jgi:hypothetical protein
LKELVALREDTRPSAGPLLAIYASGILPAPPGRSADADAKADKAMVDANADKAKAKATADATKAEAKADEKAKASK